MANLKRRKRDFKSTRGPRSDNPVPSPRTQFRHNPAGTLRSGGGKLNGRKIQPSKTFGTGLSPNSPPGHDDRFGKKGKKTEKGETKTFEASYFRLKLNGPKLRNSARQMTAGPPKTCRGAIAVCALLRGLYWHTTKALRKWER